MDAVVVRVNILGDCDLTVFQQKQEDIEGTIISQDAALVTPLIGIHDFIQAVDRVQVIREGEPLHVDTPCCV